MSNIRLYVPITEVTFRLRASYLNNVLSFEHVVNTPWFAALYILKLYILQPQFTFCSTLRFLVQQMAKDQGFIILGWSMEVIYPGVI